MRYQTSTFAAVMAASAAAGCAPASDPPSAGIDSPGVTTIEAAARIDAENLRETVAVLASDEFEGRGPASAGDIMTQGYLSTALEELGYTPAGVAGSWLQPFDIVSVTTTTPESWSFTANGNTLALRQWDEFIASSGVQEPSAAVSNAEVVFVGYGLQAPEYDWDDYKGLDVSGKLLLMLNNDPDWDPDLFEGNRRLYYGRWTYKYEIAAQLGAAGAIIIHTTPSAGYPFQVVQTSWSGPQYALPAQNEPTTAVQSWVTEEAARRLVSFAGHDLAELVASARRRDFVPVRLGVTTSLSLQNELSRVQTANVAGLLEGSDPELSDEVVVFTAHHDHLGIGEPNAAGDAIYNGARDNAVGVAQVLAVADAFRSLPVVQSL